ncbi:hypothetical protein [Vibrio nitrifigilis]|uniref:Methyl-accepting chemotaxis protein n=1 Tax=Vibrio nitrifigilis TaxID=2789781 RepID=A0ABS0GI33_9VIBR|nr:hypothetical protein [Vibrio nitrifigilis]MBF9002102.1 hypothetical protein [Vibrio nitrifigilis]
MNFIAFFIPDFNEPLQVIFSIGIFVILIVTVVALKVHAKEQNWENNWNGDLSPSDSLLSAEQGNVQTISDTVATKSEKAAEAMPGFLLIIGLLGTFLGLGIALNQASIIINSDVSGQNYSEMMSSLTQMMTGLGTKFKASIWGISGFIVLRVIIGLLGVEEKRLEWCAHKIKTDNSNNKSQLKNEEEQRLNQMLGASSNIVEAIKSTLGNQFEKQNELIDKSNNILSNVLSHTSELRQEANSHNVLLNNVLTTLKNSHTIESRMMDVITENNEVTKNIVQSLTKLDSLREINGEGVKLLNKISHTFIESSGEHKEQFNAITTHLNHVVDATIENSQRMAKFSDSTQESLLSLSESGELMKFASQGISAGADKLSTTVNSFESNMNMVMGKLTTDLGGTISDMRDSFTGSMTEMAKDLSQSTSDISNAVKENAHSVEITMETVKSSINDSLQRQQESSAEFRLSSQTLNEQMESVTFLVNDLRESIKSGLSAISRSSKEVQSLNNKYKTITESAEVTVEQNEAIRTHMQVLCEQVISSNEYSTHLESLISDIAKGSAGKFNQIISALQDKEDLKTLVEQIEHITNQLDNQSSHQQQKAKNQFDQIENAIIAINKLDTLSEGIDMNSSELKSINESLSGMSEHLSELSKKTRSRSVAAA